LASKGHLFKLERFRSQEILEILVTFSNQRYNDPPGVPCAAELGFPGHVVTYSGIYAHKDTPEHIQKTLFEAFKKTYETAEFKKAIESIGDEPRFGGREFIKESIKKMGEVQLPIIRELGLYVGGQ
jgi:tripartite-type tricarboxylate transporter receptor subunit TctC